MDRHGRVLTSIVADKLAADETFTVDGIRKELEVVIQEPISAETVRKGLVSNGMSFKQGEKQWRECSPVRCREFWANYATAIRPHHEVHDMFLDETSFDPHEVRAGSLRADTSFRQPARHAVFVSASVPFWATRALLPEP